MYICPLSIREHLPYHTGLQIAANSRGNIEAVVTDFATGHTHTSPGPVRTAAITTGNVYFCAVIIFTRSDDVLEHKICDRHARSRSLGGVIVVLLNDNAVISSV